MGRTLLVTVVMLFGLVCPWFVAAQETGQAAGNEVGDARALRAFLLEKGATEADVERVVTGAKRYGIIETASHVISYASPSQLSPDDQKIMSKFFDFGQLKQFSSQERANITAKYFLYNYIITQEKEIMFFENSFGKLKPNKNFNCLYDFFDSYNKKSGDVFFLKNIDSNIYLYRIPSYFNNHDTKYLLDDYICNSLKTKFYNGLKDGKPSSSSYDFYLFGKAATSRCLSKILPEYIELLFDEMHKVNDGEFRDITVAAVRLAGAISERESVIPQSTMNRSITFFKELEKFTNIDLTPNIWTRKFDNQK